MRLIIGGLSVFALLMVGALVAPQFIDWNKYKPQIIAQVKQNTGLDINLDGDLSMGILPSPHVSINNLSVISPRKQQFDNLLTMKKADVHVALAPLLSKQIKVTSVTLVEPNITLEILKDGTPAWQTEKLEPETLEEAKVETSDEKPVQQTSDGQGNKLDSVALDKVEIKNGQLSFINHQSGASYEVSDVNTEIKADSLQGPFQTSGDAVYNNTKIVFDIMSKELIKNRSVPLKANIKIPAAMTEFSFDGVAGMNPDIDVQGQTNFTTGSLPKLASAFGASLNSSYNKPMRMEGLVTAKKSSAKIDNLEFSYGDIKTDGQLSIDNFDTKNPMIVSGNLKTNNTINLSQLMGDKPKKGKTVQDDLESAGKSAGTNANAIVPQTLTLPFPIDIDLSLNSGAVIYEDMTIKGVAVAIAKKAKTSKIVFNAMELPGQAKANGDLTVSYASSSTSPNSGQITYADPQVTYAVQGQANQLGAFLKAVAPNVDASKITSLYKTAQINLKGSIKGNVISLSDSTAKLDDMVLGMGGSYQPETANRRAKAVIDLTANNVNIDKITGSDKKSANGNGEGAAPKGNADPLDGLRNLSLPLDLGFDVSLQQARINNADLSGLRLVGDLTASKLTLTNASVNNFAGAALSAKGVIGNLKNLSAMDVTASVKTSDLPQLANALNADISKLPSDIKSVDATISGKGSVDTMNFSANVATAGGQLDASGMAANLLKTPAFSDLSVRVKHPSAVKAIQIANPSFKGSKGLQQPLDFYSNVNSSGKVYNLSGMKLTLGQTNLNGDLKIDMSGNVNAISGAVKAGELAVDDLLGAKTSGASSGGGGSTSSGGSKWSSDPIDLNWMNKLNVNVDLSASNVTYGKWNIANPSTKFRISNGTMTVNDMTGGLFGGTATLDTEVKSNPVSVAIKSNMDNINLELLVSALSASNRLKSSGTVSFSTDVSGAGKSSLALISSLDGSAKLDGRNVIIKGFDLAKLAQGLRVEQKLSTSLTSFASGALTGGQTQFDTIEGNYAIQNGIVRITDMAMNGPAAIITTTGQADLPKWYLDIINTISFVGVDDAEPIQIPMKGSISNPKNFGTDILQDYMKDKLTRKLGKELPDILGDDVSSKLKQFGILPSGESDGGVIEKPSIDGILKGLTGASDKKKTVAEPIIIPKETETVAPVETTPEVEPTPTPAPVVEDKPAVETTPEAITEPTPEVKVEPTPTSESSPEVELEPAPTPEPTVEPVTEVPAENSAQEEIE